MMDRGNTPTPTPAQLDALARLVAQTADDEIDCGVVLERVAAYLEAHQAGETLPPALVMVQQHLTVCPECHEEFEALLRALQD